MINSEIIIIDLMKTLGYKFWLTMKELKSTDAYINVQFK